MTEPAGRYPMKLSAAGSRLLDEYIQACSSYMEAWDEYRNRAAIAESDPSHPRDGVPFLVLAGTRFYRPAAAARYVAQMDPRVLAENYRSHGGRALDARDAAMEAVRDFARQWKAHHRDRLAAARRAGLPKARRSVDTAQKIIEDIESRIANLPMVGVDGPFLRLMLRGFHEMRGIDAGEHLINDLKEWAPRVAPFAHDFVHTHHQWCEKLRDGATP